MKNIKEVLKFLLIIAIIIPFCSFVLVKADSGWDSDSGSSFGGSSFGGSSWSSSSSSGGSSGDLSDIKPYQSIIMSLFISGHMYVFFLGPVGDYLDKKNSKIKHKPLLIAARLISVVIIEIIYPLFVLFDFFGVFVLCFIGTLIKIGTESAKPVFGSSAKDVDEAIIQELLPDESIGSLKAKLFDVFTDIRFV